MKIKNTTVKKDLQQVAFLRPGKLGLLASSVMVMLVLSACTSNPTKSDPVLDRAQLRWDSIFAPDLDTAYSLYSPGYRSTNSRVDFEIELRLRRVRWTSATYKSHECTESRCLVSFDVGFLVKNPVPGLSKFNGSSVIEDTWIKTGGEWWYVPPKRD